MLNKLFKHDITVKVPTNADHTHSTKIISLDITVRHAGIWIGGESVVRVLTASLVVL